MAPNLVARQRREDATGFMVVRARFQECELRVGGCYGFTQDCIVLQCGGGGGGGMGIYFIVSASVSRVEFSIV